MKKLFSILCVAVLAGTLFFNTSLIVKRGSGVNLSSIIANANAQVEEPEEFQNHTPVLESCQILGYSPSGEFRWWDGTIERCTFAHNQVCYQTPCTPNQ